MELSKSDIFDLIGSIYDGGLDPESWPIGLGKACRYFNADMAQMLFIDKEDFYFSFASGYGFDPYAHNIGASKFRRYLSDDPIMIYGISHLNEAYSDIEVIDQKKLRSSKMQTDIRNPANMVHLLTVFISDEGFDWTGLCFFRGKEKLAFEKKDVENLNFLVPHFRRSTRIQKTMGSLTKLNALQANILDRIPEGIIVLDELHEVVICNIAAKSIIDASDAIKISKGHIICRIKSDNSTLHHSIDSAIDNRSVDSNRFAVRIKSSKDNDHILCVATSLRFNKFDEKINKYKNGVNHYTARLPSKSYCLLTICKPSSYKNREQEFLEQMFELTPSEAKLASQIANGESLKDIAESLGRTEGTARVQLQSIFEKTNTNRQSSLVRLLMAAP
jgi:DNA-binding CsgD family transcriptional regulator/PAS domain-containing protein